MGAWPGGHGRGRVAGTCGLNIKITLCVVFASRAALHF